jgi:hypothetical protein
VKPTRVSPARARRRISASPTATTPVRAFSLRTRRASADALRAVPCKTISSTRVGFTFAGRSFPVVGFNFGPTSSQKDRCVGSVVGSQVADDVSMSPVPFCVDADASLTVPLESWVIGGAFLSGVYSVYDLGQKRVGFAEQA